MGTINEIRRWRWTERGQQDGRVCPTCRRANGQPLPRGEGHRVRAFGPCVRCEAWRAVGGELRGAAHIAAGVRRSVRTAGVGRSVWAAGIDAADLGRHVARSFGSAVREELVYRHALTSRWRRIRRAARWEIADGEAVGRRSCPPWVVVEQRRQTWRWLNVEPVEPVASVRVVSGWLIVAGWAGSVMVAAREWWRAGAHRRWHQRRRWLEAGQRWGRRIGGAGSGASGTDGGR